MKKNQDLFGPHPLTIFRRLTEIRIGNYIIPVGRVFREDATARITNGLTGRHD